MKIVPTRILILLALIFPLADCIAAPVNSPPPPTNLPPPPPGLPVDHGIVLLLVASILYGIYKVYQFNLNKKTPS